MPMPGGFSDAKPSDADIEAVVNDAAFKSALGEKLGMTVDSVTVESYQTQVVAGLNYHIKAKVNGSKSAEIHAFKPLPHTGKPVEVTKAEAH